eukprot:CAMPEP_0184700186 /NCGR_PEP_ID=MMETSP0313-20130426/9693_1 /TAXON_ID=2792 /ORGANISM="Porphyridium aerugineum, Strain SAG 1380-2" /LENGTH=1144 /DNA_ID=CAMNT_0027159685 /DNA_START=1460 /DNA_END=4894 /DNA_ORIENTATION=-
MGQSQSDLYRDISDPQIRTRLNILALVPPSDRPVLLDDMQRIQKALLRPKDFAYATEPEHPNYKGALRVVKEEMRTLNAMWQYDIIFCYHFWVLVRKFVSLQIGRLRRMRSGGTNITNGRLITQYGVLDEVERDWMALFTVARVKEQQAALYIFRRAYAHESGEEVKKWSSAPKIPFSKTSLALHGEMRCEEMSDSACAAWIFTEHRLTGIIDTLRYTERGRDLKNQFVRQPYNRSLSSNQQTPNTRPQATRTHGASHGTWTMFMPQAVQYPTSELKVSEVLERSMWNSIVEFVHKYDTPDGDLRARLLGIYGQDIVFRYFSEALEPWQDGHIAESDSNSGSSSESESCVGSKSRVGVESSAGVESGVGVEPSTGAESDAGVERKVHNRVLRIHMTRYAYVGDDGKLLTPGDAMLVYRYERYRALTNGAVQLLGLWERIDFSKSTPDFLQAIIDYLFAVLDKYVESSYEVFCPDYLVENSGSWHHAPTIRYPSWVAFNDGRMEFVRYLYRYKFLSAHAQVKFCTDAEYRKASPQWYNRDEAERRVIQTIWSDVFVGFGRVRRDAAQYEEGVVKSREYLYDWLERLDKEGKSKRYAEHPWFLRLRNNLKPHGEAQDHRNTTFQEMLEYEGRFCRPIAAPRGETKRKRVVAQGQTGPKAAPVDDTMPVGTATSEPARPTAAPHGETMQVGFIPAESTAAPDGESKTKRRQLFRGRFFETPEEMKELHVLRDRPDPNVDESGSDEEDNSSFATAVGDVAAYAGGDESDADSYTVTIGAVTVGAGASTKSGTRPISSYHIQPPPLHAYKPRDAMDPGHMVPDVTITSNAKLRENTIFTMDVPIRERIMAEEDQKCFLCQNLFAHGDTVRGAMFALDCTHRFHIECIKIYWNELIESARSTVPFKPISFAILQICPNCARVHGACVFCGFCAEPINDYVKLHMEIVMNAENRGVFKKEWNAGSVPSTKSFHLRCKLTPPGMRPFCHRICGTCHGIWYGVLKQLRVSSFTPSEVLPEHEKEFDLYRDVAGRGKSLICGQCHPGPNLQTSNKHKNFHTIAHHWKRGMVNYGCVKVHAYRSLLDKGLLKVPYGREYLQYAVKDKNSVADTEGNIFCKWADAHMPRSDPRFVHTGVRRKRSTAELREVLNEAT